MLLFARVWTAVTSYFGLSSLTDYEIQQQPIGGIPHSVDKEPYNGLSKSLVFVPPGSNLPDFKCDYSNMGHDWVDCTEIPGCWVRNKKTHEKFTTKIDYEALAPIGITRNYVLHVTDGHHMNQDGIVFTEGKLFNGQFPGPLLEACWGDTLNITVINESKFNGTSIHWHGIRQNQTMHMDGVNGITQCPIAPNDRFTYVWKAVQYGSSWYHSHYSVQYADGLQAPITIHGPTTLAYDEAVYPLITSDWLHNSAFDAIYTQNVSYPTILLNGTGSCTRFLNSTNQINATCDAASIPKGFEMEFENKDSEVTPGKKRLYLLRIINTSFTTAITFSIDNHYMSVVEADFVPVKNTTKVTSILVAIGQRYHVIVEAEPQGEKIPADLNFWIRTNSSGCRDDVTGDDGGYERTGVLYYKKKSATDPTSCTWKDIPKVCVDTLSTQLVPAYNWTVTSPKNGPRFGNQSHTGEELQVGGFLSTPNTTYALGHFSLNRPGSKFTPFQTTYGNPTFLNLDNFDQDDPDSTDWPAGWVVIPEDFNSTNFVYLVLEGHGHPIHLHGHDFAIIEYDATANFDPSVIKPCYNNPIRRDVVLLPATDVDSTTGYAVIAFKTDNPGAWLMHCHIALHASWGLSLQIMERQPAANKIWQPGNSTALTQARRTCMNWNSWAYDCRNAWPGNTNSTECPVYPACDNGTVLQSDSGI